MSIVSRLFSRRSAAAPRPFQQVIAALDGAGYGRASAGMVVNATTAMQVVTVMACVRALADGCATPSLHVFRDRGDGKRELARNIPEYRLLNRRPNEWQTSIEFRRTMTMFMLLTGNAVALKIKAGNRVRELIPVRPEHISIEENSRYDIRYRITDQFGLVGVFGPDDVLHLPNWQWDRVRGLDAVRLAREAIGLAMASEGSQSALHANGGRPSGLLSSPNPVSAEATARVRDAWKLWVSENRHGVPVLDNGFTYHPIAISGVDSQHVETRRLQIEEICRGFGVFPIMIGHSDKTATFASSEAFFAAHYKHSLRPLHELWVQRIDEFVLDGAGPLYCEFDVRYLLAGSMKDRAVWARTMAEMGIYTRNELRDEEGKDPLPGLDDPLTPLNMMQPGSDPAATDENSDDDGSGSAALNDEGAKNGQ